MNTCPQGPLTSPAPIQEIPSEEIPSETAFQKLFDEIEGRADEKTDLPPSLFDLIEEEEEGENPFVSCNFSLQPPSIEEENPFVSCGFTPQPLFIQGLSSVNTSSIQEVSLPSPLLEALFEKMASSMVIMTSSHEQQTSLVLDAPRFSSSCLFGTRITITEFSTAPKAFNVEILSNPEALALIQESSLQLLATFDKGNFPFTINRFDTHLQPTRSRFVLQRKENEDHGEQDQHEGQNS
jgi:hypothetical protein